MTKEDESHVRDSDERPALPSAQSWLIDGFNVIHSVLLGGGSREDWWKRATRDRLLERIAYFEGEVASLVVVFDGDRDPTQSGGTTERDGARPVINVVFRPSADDWIVQSVRGARDAGGAKTIGVVTGDRQVAGRCTHAGAVVVRPKDFLAHCPDPNESTDNGGDDPSISSPD